MPMVKWGCDCEGRESMNQFRREKFEANFRIHKSNITDEGWGSFNSKGVKKKSSRESEGEEEQWKRDGGVGREIVMYILWGGMAAQSKEGKVTYEGRSRKCIVVKEGMGVKEVIRMVKGITGTDMSEKKTLYDREMLLAVEGDTDVKMILKGNDEHSYLYVGGNKGPLRRAQEGVIVYKGRVRACHDGKVCSRSGKAGTTKQEANGRALTKTYVMNYTNKYRVGKLMANVLLSLVSEEGEQPQSRLHVGGDTIELSDDDEISITSEDAGDEETTE
ncbi:hypothetical protein Cgig2_012534 [Carnegiea gigantea]|uniref:Uncharacterized protein n=1 Tax=Carnegiea gigantea TaxID=171969 RepID=A0A9Q1GJP6_9CARY|nr:hypothetical protein Cgig2_012534 [Carnegiea gigantea]